MDEQDIRIEAILGEDCERTSETLEKYARHLKEALEFPCLLTGAEDFPWEERYVLGGGNKKEYERLKKDNPSFRDHFSLLEIPEYVPGEEDIFVKVERVSDKKAFEVELSWLKCVDRKHPNFQTLDDYAVWHTNYC